MKKKINIDGKLYQLVEEEKPALEIGEWYCTDMGGIKYYALFLGDSLFNVGFINGYWHPNINFSNPKIWKSSDMDEVERLLIAEAEKRGFKPYDFFNTPNWQLIENRLYMCIGRYETKLIFCDGKWAEIIEEKTPLYTSLDGKGTEFFEGDKAWYVMKETNELISIYVNPINKGNYLENGVATEIMSKKEAYQYLADNCKE